ncbi:MAG TPA: YkvA family protein, partial [Gillisia sp.]|nr:YkvA family protein [Gillisia sp.]
MGFLQKLKEKVKHLKSEIQVLSIAYSDKRTPWTAKLLIGLTVGYLLSPIDLVPDFIPVLGILDDLILVP